MAREMRFVHNWNEVAPSLLIARSKSRRSSKIFKLDPINEDEAQGSKLLYKEYWRIHVSIAQVAIALPYHFMLQLICISPIQSACDVEIFHFTISLQFICLSPIQLTRDAEIYNR
ncbi:hypothetical protein CR513_45480, partial [Mucuna pruriens]